MNTNVEVLEKEFEILIEDAKNVYKKMERKKESLNDYYKIRDEVDRINELLGTSLKATLTYYLKKHNIITKMNFLFKEQNKIDFEDLILTYQKNKENKSCNIKYKGYEYDVIQPSLRECLNLILEEDHFLYPLLYIHYSNKEKKCHFQEAVIINMLAKKIEH